MGGIGVALSKMAIASQLGMTIDLSKINSFGSTNTLFSESQSRIIISIKPKNKRSVEKLFQNQDLNYLGKCHSAKIVSMRISNNNSFHVSIKDLTKKYKKNISKL